jgi:hypothetical protein
MAVALAVLALALIEGTARADDALARARRAVATSDYVAARTELAAARDAGDHSPDDTAAIYRLTGIVEAALGNSDAATTAFIQLLALTPGATMSAGTSPKIRQPFDDAVRFLAGRAPLQVRTETRAAPPAISLIVVSDPVGMVARVRVVYAIDRGAERITDARASRRTDIALPAGGRIDARVIALDTYGNRLVELGSKDAPITILGASPARPVPGDVTALTAVSSSAMAPRDASITARAARPIYLRWWPYAVATGVSAGVTAYFGWAAYSDVQDLWRLPSEDPRAGEVADRGRRNTMIANIGFGVTGAFAVAAAVMYAVESRAGPEQRTKPRVTAVPLRAGGALVIGGTF